MKLHDELLHYGVLGMKWGVRNDPYTRRNLANEKYFRKQATRYNKKAEKAAARGHIDKQLNFEERAALAIKRAEGKRLNAKDRRLKDRIYREKIEEGRKIGLLAVPITVVSKGAGVGVAAIMLAKTKSAEDFQNRMVVDPKVVSQ